MSHHEFGNRVLDARPDRIDFRDRTYSPPLVSLPESCPSVAEISEYLPQYHKTSKILDQGKEGACTGFGLAAVINYILWERWLLEQKEKKAAHDDSSGAFVPDPAPVPVSPWMLYENAQLYDEWEGEDYSGSSCRGAMKGWHKHGACENAYWPKLTTSKKRPEDEWSRDAARRPLGAYYRVDARSISDMQAAVHEVRAVYCSARVHEGWWLDGTQATVSIAGLDVPVITLSPKMTGGHAFAIVGYTKHGFIVQNSWGDDWGQNGFALLTYEDWAKNGDDAWVAAIAAPMMVSEKASVPTARSSSGTYLSSSTMLAANPNPEKHAPWSMDKAYEHSVVMGNDGKLLRRLIGTANPADNLQKVAFELPDEAIRDGKKHLVIYAHGGLNSEEAAIGRARRMGPWFDANGIHPIFLVWRTSLLESIGQIGEDIVGGFLKEQADLRSEGLGDIIEEAKKKLQNKFDKAFEAVAEKVVGKAVWSQMKQNAGAAANGVGGTRQLTNVLGQLRDKHADLSVHMLGHSAGSILLGHMLDDLKPERAISTMGLYAPACTMQFAVQRYGKALKRGVIGDGKLHVDNLTDQNERDDTVGPYGKSLLYLVSRAFEDPRKMPLMGLASAWEPGSKDLSQLKKDLGTDFAEGEIKHIRDWDEIRDEFNVAHERHADKEVVEKITKPDGKKTEHRIDIAHGSFDNDLSVVNASVARILGKTKPAVEITDLSGF